MHSLWWKCVYHPYSKFTKKDKSLKYLKELEESQWFPREQLLAMQWERLQSLIRFAYDNIPYYKRMFTNIGASPEDIRSLEDFSKLPILTRRDVQENEALLVAPNWNGKIDEGTTSASTGESVRVWYSTKFMSYNMAAILRGRGWFGTKPWDKWVGLWGRPIHSQLAKWLYGVKCRFRNCLYIPAFDFSADVFSLHWTRIKRWNPSYIYGYASAIYELTCYLKKNEKQEEAQALGLLAIFSTAEVLHEYWRDLIEEVFTCKVANEYGGTETGAFTFECPERQWHISVENVLVEIVQDGKGEMGEIVVTPLHNYYMPLIRYNIGDVGALQEGSCPCGRNLPLMDMRVGKVVDAILTPSGKKISAEIFDYINKGMLESGIGGIRQFKAIQKTIDYFVVQVVKDETFSTLALDFFRRMMKEMLGDVKVEFEIVENIPREASGKLRYFVPLQEAENE